MYSCPTDDIHSIYLDGELPSAFKNEYEAHIAGCSECKKKLETFRRIKNLLKSDSASIQLNEQFLDQSFERLKTKMRYSKNSKNVKEFPLSEKTLRWAFSAAAAVIIAAVLPVSISNGIKSNDFQKLNLSSITPVTRPQNQPIAKQNVIINGNLNRDLAQTVGNANFSNFALTNVDVLRPDFDDLKKLHVDITVPGLEDGQETAEIKMPENFNEGQLPWVQHRH